MSDFTKNAYLLLSGEILSVEYDPINGNYT
jgi:hypothetical protein